MLARPSKMHGRNLSTKVFKCEFHTDSVDYIGYIVNQQGVDMDLAKIASIRGWPELDQCLSSTVLPGPGLRQLFYRQFIKDYSELTTPLMSLIRKGEALIWATAATIAFKTLKEAFEGDSILRHYNPLLLIELETDTSNFAIGAVLSQHHTAKTPSPIAFLPFRPSQPFCPSRLSMVRRT